MYSLIIGLGGLLLVAIWGGAAPVHAVSSDFVVEAVITGGTRLEPEGEFTVTNNTADFLVKAFAVTLGNALSANTTRPMWTAQATDENPIPGLPGAGGGIGSPVEYVFYTSTGNYLAPGEVDNSFTFSLFQGPLLSSAVGILAVDNSGAEFTCISREEAICAEGICTVAVASSDCTAAVASVSTLWPPNHTFVPIHIVGVTTSYESPVSITIDSIKQDEPVQKTGTGSGNTCQDGRGVGTYTARVRAERAGKGNGRVYHIAFTADNGQGTCTEVVRVCVPHDQGRGKTCIDDGPLYDSTVCP